MAQHWMVRTDGTGPLTRSSVSSKTRPMHNHFSGHIMNGKSSKVTGTRLDLRSTQEVYNLPCMTCITKIFQPTESPLIIPYHAIPDITVPTDTGDKLMPTQGRGFPGFLPVCMQGTWGWFSSQVCSFPTAWKSITCTHAYDHITWNNKFPQSKVML